MKKYIIPLIIFVVVGGIGMLLFKVLEIFFNAELSSILLRLFWSLIYVLLTIKLIDEKRSLLNIHRITNEQLLLTFVLIILFAINNYFFCKYADNIDFARGGGIYLVIFGFIVNSFFEEFTYRGFIQNYINQNRIKLSIPLSRGNLVASILMTFTHLGFYTIMDSFFATINILLVLIYSLTAGYIRDKGGSIWFLIIIHTVINLIHLYFNIDNY